MSVHLHVHNFALSIPLLRSPNNNKFDNTDTRPLGLTKMSNMETTTSTEPKTDPSPAKCHLLNLPAELRLIIYEELFRATPLDFTKIWSTTRSIPSPALLATCKTIRAEAGKFHLDGICKELTTIAKQCDKAQAEYKALSEQSGQAVILQGGRDAPEAEVAALKAFYRLGQTYIKGKILVGEELKRWRAQGYVYKMVKA